MRHRPRPPLPVHSNRYECQTYLLPQKEECHTIPPSVELTFDDFKYDGSVNVWCCGQVNWIDIFGKPHSRGFLFRYTKDGFRSAYNRVT